MFKDIPGYEGLYMINEHGDVYSCYYKRLKIPQISKDGYYTVQLWKNGKAKRYKVHRLVAITFLPNPENKPIVMHKDNNKLNPELDNLQWGTLSENSQQAYADNLMHYPETHAPYVTYELYNTYNGKSMRVCGYQGVIDAIEYGTVGTVSAALQRGTRFSKGPLEAYRIRKIENRTKPFTIGI